MKQHINSENLPEDYYVNHSTRIFQAHSSKGKLKFWEGQVITDGETFCTRTVSWQETTDGYSKKIYSDPKVIAGKNIGKANETTPQQQAISEIESNKERKRDSRYWLLGTDKPEELPLPMLAHEFGKRKKNIVWPAFIQPKLDGCRMLFDGTIGWSRKGKPFIAQVIEHLKVTLPEGIILDGELMLDHNLYTFQDTMKAIKKFRPDHSNQLKFFVYDLIDTNDKDLTFIERVKKLSSIVKNLTNNSIEFVTTDIVKDEDDVYTKHTEYVSQGYEGAIIRNRNAAYKRKDRSADLLKYKHFDDDEFEITGFTEGVAKFTGTIIFECVTEDGKDFTVTPKGSLDSRKEMFNNGKSYIGKKLTVQYQGLSDEGVPRFPVGITVRDSDTQG